MESAGKAAQKAVNFVAKGYWLIEGFPTDGDEDDLVSFFATAGWKIEICGAWTVGGRERKLRVAAETPPRRKLCIG